MHDIKERDYIRSLARGLEVVRAFAGGPRRLTPAEVARRAGLTRAAARRSLLTLSAEGYATVDDGAFALSERVLSLGLTYLSSLSLWDVALPAMESLSRKTQRSCSVYTLDGKHTILLAHVPVNGAAMQPMALGSRLPAHRTAAGQVLLCALDADGSESEERVPPAILGADLIERIRSRGFALVEPEIEPSRSGIAVPIVERRTASVQLALAMHGPAGESSNDLARILASLREASSQISGRLDGGMRRHQRPTNIRAGAAHTDTF